jgi:hypothetical protein
MRYVLIFVAAFVPVSVASAGKWTVTIDRIEVAPTKASGLPWDADDSAPDFGGRLVLGVVEDGTCTTSQNTPPIIPRHQDEFLDIQKHQDQFIATEIGKLTLEAPGDAALCVFVSIWDRDLIDDDLIVWGRFPLPATGTQDLSVGQATIRVTVRSPVKLSLRQASRILVLPLKPMGAFPPEICQLIDAMI